MHYTETHEWLTLDGDIVTVGITEQGLRALGPIEFVELPEPEAMVASGDEIAVIEGADGSVDVLAPLDGEVVEVNAAVLARPALVGEDPTGAAWLFRLRVEDPEIALADALDEEAYRDLADEAVPPPAPRPAS